jgi:hypothetical protein
MQIAKNDVNRWFPCLHHDQMQQLQQLHNQMQYRRHNSFLCNVDCVHKIYTQFTAHFTPCLHDVQTDGADVAILFKRAVKRVVKRAVYSLPAGRPNRWSRRRHPFQACSKACSKACSLLLACKTSKQMEQTSPSFSSAAAFKGPSFSARVLNTSIISPAAAQLRQYSHFCSSKASKVCAHTARAFNCCNCCNCCNSLCFRTCNCLCSLCLRLETVPHSGSWNQ